MRELVSQFRFSLDCPDEAFSSKFLDPSETLNTGLRHYFLSNSLRITPSVTPRLSRVMESVSERLRFQGDIESFVFAGAEPNAFCAPVPGSSLFCVMVSSGLVNLMTDAELQFVIGHEIGHFIFEHYRYPSPEAFGSGLAHLLMLRVRRAAEISADRIGGVAAPALEDGITALIKVASGLPSNELTLKMSDILQQVRDLDGLGPQERTLYETHPSVPVRAKALFRFAHSEIYHVFRELDGEPLFSKEQLDEHVAKDITGHHQGTFNSLENDLIGTFVLWSAILVFASDRRITHQEREALECVAGPERVAPILEELSSLSQSRIEEKIRRCGQELTQLPGEYAKKAITEVAQLLDISSSSAKKEFEFIASTLQS